MTTYPLTAAEHLEYWTALRNRFAAKCSAARISGDYPAQFRAWEAEIRRADVRLHMLARTPHHKRKTAPKTPTSLAGATPARGIANPPARANAARQERDDTMTTATPAPIAALTPAEITAACLAAVNDRDPRIVAALDVIEAVARNIDGADLLGDRFRLVREALEQVEHILSRPAPSTVSQ